MSPFWKAHRKREEPSHGAGRLAFIYGLTLVGLGFVVLYAVQSLFPKGSETDGLPFVDRSKVDKFANFVGHKDCGITSQQVYLDQPYDALHLKQRFPFCPNRERLLTALRGGGRIGFDEPFVPKGCHYRWYNTEEICMILDRFDGLVFIGDTMLRHIYAAFNILLRENMALGGLEQWRPDEKKRQACRCEHQFTNPDCWEYIVSGSQEVAQQDGEGGHKSPYACNRMMHFFLSITDSPASDAHHQKVTDLLSKNARSYKPIPLILSLGLSTSLSWPVATSAMDEWISVIEPLERNTPFLWVTPNAAGHLKPPNKILSEGNNAMWHYTVETGKEARKRGLEVLGLYNSTLQAGSWDGSHYGMKVALVQAMMIINWLSRLEST